MIPTTVLEVLLFLVLVAPGLCYELLRERRRPALEETAFREASRIALASIAFDCVGLLVVALARVIAPSTMPDPGQWLDHPHEYVRDHYRLIATAIAVFVTLSVALAVVADQVRRRRATGDIRPGGTWYQLFRTDRPDGTVPWVSVRLTDGTEIAGFLSYYVSAEIPANRELALKQNAASTGLQMRRANSGEVEKLDGWSNVVLRGDVIDYLKVKYMPAAPGTKTRRRRLFD